MRVSKLPEEVVKEIQFLKTKEGGFKTLSEIKEIISEKYGIDLSINRISRVARFGDIKRVSIGFEEEDIEYLKEKYGSVSAGVKNLVKRDKYLQKMPADVALFRAVTYLRMASKEKPDYKLEFKDCVNLLLQEGIAKTTADAISIIGDLQGERYLCRERDGKIYIPRERLPSPELRILGMFGMSKQ
jgi:hypothetical protein